MKKLLAKSLIDLIPSGERRNKVRISKCLVKPETKIKSVVLEVFESDEWVEVYQIGTADEVQL